MSFITMAEQATAPSTPAANKVGVFVDAAGILCWRDDTGKVYAQTRNAAVAAQSPAAATDVYIINSDLVIPTTVGALNLQAKGTFRWQISASKTGAGVAAPIYVIRIGTGKAITDTAMLTLTGPLQTAIADKGTLNIIATLRAVGTGTSAVLQGTAWWDHTGTAANTTTSGTGFANDSTGHVEGTSAGFDSSGKGAAFVGLSINAGAAAAWTITQVIAEANW